MKLFLSILFVFGFMPLLYSQNTYNNINTFYGNSSTTTQLIPSVVKSNSNLFCSIMMTDTSQFQFTEVVKFDLFGNLVKRTNIRDTVSNTGPYPGHSIILDKDSNIIINGFATNNTTNSTHGFILKLDKNLDTLWSKIYKIPDTLAGCTIGLTTTNYFTCLKEDPNGGYILGGIYWANCQTGNTALYLTKYDTAGTLLWVKTYPSIQGCYDFEIANDGGFYIPSFASGSGLNCRLFKIDTIGNINWSVNANSNSSPHFDVDAEFFDSNHIITASAFVFDFNQVRIGITISKINIKTKLKIWERNYYLFNNFRTPDLNQYFKLRILPNKDILIAGTAKVFSWDSLQGDYKGVLFRLDQNGDSLWCRYYHTSQSFNDPDVFCDVELMPDGGFLAVGYHNPEVEGLNWAAWMVRTDSLGNAPMDGSVSVESIKLKAESCKMKIYPNPAHDYLTLDYKTASKNYKELWVELRDVQGKLVMKQQLKGGDNEELIGLKDFKSGQYLVNLIADQKVLKSEKITITQ